MALLKLPLTLCATRIANELRGFRQLGQINKDEILRSRNDSLLTADGCFQFRLLLVPARADVADAEESHKAFHTAPFHARSFFIHGLALEVGRKRWRRCRRQRPPTATNRNDPIISASPSGRYNKLEGSSGENQREKHNNNDNSIFINPVGYLLMLALKQWRSTSFPFLVISEERIRKRNLL